MTTKAFSILLLVSLVMGVALGGAFAGGFALGQSRGPDQGNDQGSSSLRPPSGFPSAFQGGGGARSGGREVPVGSAEGRLASGTGQGFFGSIASFQNGVMTLDSPLGQVQASIFEGTAIQKTVNGSADDLVVGADVRILGRRVQDGPVQARSITLAPSGLEGFSGPPSGGPRGLSGGVSLSGTIQGVENGLVTVATADGPLQVAAANETAIQKLEAGILADLVEGARVRILGSPNEEGMLQASLVILAPEAADRFLRRGDRRGNR